MSEAAWVLRCRGPQGAPATLDLPQGGVTTVSEIAELAGKALRVARNRRATPLIRPPGRLVGAPALRRVSAESQPQRSLVGFAALSNEHLKVGFPHRRTLPVIQILNPVATLTTDS